MGYLLPFGGCAITTVLLGFPKKGTRYVEFRRSVKVGLERGFDYENGEPIRGSLNMKIRNRLDTFIPKSMDFFNQNSGFC